MASTIELLKLLLPELLVTHFDISSHKKDNDVLHLYFEEKADLPPDFNSKHVISHGFHKEITVQDFPIRGKKVFLHIKRRRWLNKQSKQTLHRDWNLVAQGTRMTIEFAAFLKALNHYKAE